MILRDKEIGLAKVFKEELKNIINEMGSKFSWQFYCVGLWGLVRLTPVAEVPQVPRKKQN